MALLVVSENRCLETGDAGAHYGCSQRWGVIRVPVHNHSHADANCRSEKNGSETLRTISGHLPGTAPTGDVPWHYALPAGLEPATSRLEVCTVATY